MKLFLFYLIAAFLVGLVARWKRPIRFLVVLGLALFAVFGYFFLNQI